MVLVQRLVMKKQNHTSDHLPVMVSINGKFEKNYYTKKITKRLNKNFSGEAWNKSLQKQELKKVTSANSLDEMVEVFLILIMECRV